MRYSDGRLGSWRSLRSAVVFTITWMALHVYGLFGLLSLPRGCASAKFQSSPLQLRRQFDATTLVLFDSLLQVPEGGQRELFIRPRRGALRSNADRKEFIDVETARSRDSSTCRHGNCSSAAFSRCLYQMAVSSEVGVHRTPCPRRPFLHTCEQTFAVEARLPLEYETRLDVEPLVASQPASPSGPRMSVSTSTFWSPTDRRVDWRLRQKVSSELW